MFLVAGCKKEAAAPSKSVEQFTASNSGIASLQVAIDNTKRTITIKAACPTNQDAITVSAVVSAKAVCSLATGTVLDLRGTQKFTVTAEDGSAQSYSVFVQGCSLYGSHFYRGCGIFRTIDCTVQDGSPAVFSGNGLTLRFKELPDSGGAGVEDDFKVVLNLPDSGFASGSPKDYTISSGSGAGFSFSSSTLSYYNGPSGKVSVTNVDTENRLFSGSFYFGQKSDATCGNNTDYIAGEFYSVPF